MMSWDSPPPPLLPWCSPRSAGSSPAGPGLPPAGEAETGTEPIMVIKAIAEPAAARCRPALLVRRMGTPISSRCEGVAHRCAAPEHTVGQTLRQLVSYWPELARCVTMNG